MKPSNLLPLLLLSTMFFTQITTQEDTPPVLEGYFCEVDADCDRPRTICVLQNGIKSCKRKEVFPLYGRKSIPGGCN